MLFIVIKALAKRDVVGLFSNPSVDSVLFQLLASLNLCSFYNVKSVYLCVCVYVCVCVCVCVCGH